MISTFLVCLKSIAYFPNVSKTSISSQDKKVKIPQSTRTNTMSYLGRPLTDIGSVSSEIEVIFWRKVKQQPNNVFTG